MLSNAINMYDNYINPPKPETRDPSLPGPSSSSVRSDPSTFDQTEAGLNVAAFNKTEPIADRVAQELEDWILDGKKEKEEKKDDGL